MKSFFHDNAVKLVILAGAIVALSISSIGCLREGFTENPKLYIERFDFEPVDGSYDMQRYDLPANSLHASHVELYRVILELNRKVDKTEQFNLQIMADNGQSKIGIIEVTIPENQDQPLFLYQPNMGASTTPVGVPPYPDGQFWLACTSPNGHVRGNAGHSTGTGSPVVLRLGFKHEVQSEQHQITCSY